MGEYNGDTIEDQIFRISKKNGLEHSKQNIYALIFWQDCGDTSYVLLQIHQRISITYEDILKENLQI
jgi:hypothetical protein